MEKTASKYDKRLKKIGERIKELRIKTGAGSYEAFAWDHDLSRQSYWRLEKGVNFRIETLLRVLDIHKISLEKFFKGLR